MALLFPPIPRAIRNMYIAKAAGIDELVPELNGRLAEVDYEALYDVIHGLPLVAKFKDGRRETFSDLNSLGHLMRSLRRSSIVEVDYLPIALIKIGNILKESCLVLQRPDCEQYDSYLGLIDRNPRPFSLREEQAIKWATLHQAPGEGIKATFKMVPRSEYPLRVTHYHRSVSESAKRIVNAIFPPQEAEALYKALIVPMLNASFEVLWRALYGLKSN